MIHSLSLRKRSLFFFALIGLLSSILLAACDGSALINVNYDPTEGVGNIVIIGNQDDQPAAQQTDPDTSMSQLLLFGLVIALLLGTIAIVMSVSRRPR